jgi:tRNA(fMet)-specific endonuclease VapC
MSLFVLDTDTLTLYYRGDTTVVRNIQARAPADLAITVMTIDEQLTGWYTLTRRDRQSVEIAQAYANLADSVVRLSKWRVLPYTESAIASVAQLKGQK